MKHKLFSTVAGLFTFSALFAQLPVSQTAENKNVVLEEFTGIYCTWCPDGHKRAQNYKDANPDDVVLVNVHTGGYANPNGNDPDFRTPFGSALANQSGLTGYPSGTINRHVFSGSNTILTRDQWVSKGNIILGESSYANVALESSLNPSTRELTVDVEVYYTGDGSATNKLNVALLQNGIEGPQTGMSNNPDQVLPNGNYEHNHVLRHFLTGQWGDDITTTTQGTLIQRQYVYTIPNDLNGVNYELGNLEVAAYVAEGHQEIITGANGPMTYEIPPGVTIVDLAASTSMQAPSDYCSTTVTPEITVINEDAETVTAYDVSYSLNGGAPVTENITTALASGETNTVTFQDVTLPVGESQITYEVTLPSGSSHAELIIGNNSVSSDVMYIVPPSTFATTHEEDFESNMVGGTIFSNALLENPDEERVYVVNNSISSSVNHSLGGFGNSEKSLRWNFYSISAGQEVSLVFHKMDFSSGTDYGLTFNHAYAQFTSQNDKLEVLVSTDCGATWNSEFSKQGTNLTTAPASSGNFYPTAEQWKSNFVDLTAYEGESEVMVAFKGSSAYGNNLYIDDILISDGLTANVSKESNFVAGVNAYPNPANNVINVDFELNTQEEVNVSIVNTMGQIVSSIDLGAVSGTQTTQLDVSSLESGMYIVKVQTTNGEQTKRISVIK